MRPTPYVASLRIYEPITAFSPAEALRWQSIPITATTARDEQSRALRRTIIIEPPALKSDGAHILEWEGKRYVCPWSTAARVWAALDQFKDSVPLPVSKFFIPADEYALEGVRGKSYYTTGAVYFEFEVRLI